MPFEVRAVPTGDEGVALFALAGELDLATVDTVRAAAEPACTKGRHVVLDMTGVGFCDSTGLGMIISLFRQANSAGGHLVLAEPQPRIRYLLEISGVDQVVPIRDTVDEAVQSRTNDNPVRRSSSGDPDEASHAAGQPGAADG
jgi:anti-sigma B factor antagonist